MLLVLIADLQISNSNQLNQNMERFYILGVSRSFVRLYAMFRDVKNTRQFSEDGQTITVRLIC